jgi:hypothetical protein
LPGQLDHILHKPFFVCSAPRHMALCGAMLTKHTTGTAFRNTKRIAHLINASAAARGA